MEQERPTAHAPGSPNHPPAQRDQPVFKHQNWAQLVILSLGNNNFEGEIPLEIYSIPILSYLDISNNQ